MKQFVKHRCLLIQLRLPGREVVVAFSQNPNGGCSSGQIPMDIAHRLAAQSAVIHHFDGHSPVLKVELLLPGFQCSLQIGTERIGCRTRTANAEEEKSRQNTGY